MVISTNCSGLWLPVDIVKQLIGDIPESGVSKKRVMALADRSLTGAKWSQRSGSKQSGVHALSPVPSDSVLCHKETQQAAGVYHDLQHSGRVGGGQ